MLSNFPRTHQKYVVGPAVSPGGVTLTHEDPSRDWCAMPVGGCAREWLTSILSLGLCTSQLMTEPQPGC